MEFDELPVGFGMALAMNPPAWNAYSAMTAEQKQAILNNVKSKEQMHRIVSILMLLFTANVSNLRHKAAREHLSPVNLTWKRGIEEHISLQIAVRIRQNLPADCLYGRIGRDKQTKIHFFEKSHLRL